MILFFFLKLLIIARTDLIFILTTRLEIIISKIILCFRYNISLAKHVHDDGKCLGVFWYLNHMLECASTYYFALFNDDYIHFLPFNLIHVGP